MSEEEEEFILIEPNGEENSPKAGQPDHFEQYMKAVREKKKEDEFDPQMLDYIIDSKTSLRFEYIKEIKNEHTRIQEMTGFLQETYKLDFPEEFYQWMARDILGLKYKKWEIDEMKRQYRIKKKRELKKLEEERKKNKGKKKNKKKNQVPAMQKITNRENPFVVKF